MCGGRRGRIIVRAHAPAHHRTCGCGAGLLDLLLLVMATVHVEVMTSKTIILGIDLREELLLCHFRLDFYSLVV